MQDVVLFADLSFDEQDVVKSPAFPVLSPSFFPSNQSILPNNQNQLPNNDNQHVSDLDMFLGNHNLLTTNNNTANTTNIASAYENVTLGQVESTEVKANNNNLDIPPPIPTKQRTSVVENAYSDVVITEPTPSLQPTSPSRPISPAPPTTLSPPPQLRPKKRISVVEAYSDVEITQPPAITPDDKMQLGNKPAVPAPYRPANAAAPHICNVHTCHVLFGCILSVSWESHHSCRVLIVTLCNNDYTIFYCT